MLDRVRWLLRPTAPTDPGSSDQRLDPAGDGPLTEGVYAGPGRIAHYALEDRTKMLCGKPPTDLHRWASS